MEKSSKPNMNASSLIDLKAELYRKHEEFKQLKNTTGTLIKGRTQEKTKPDLFSQKNKGVLERAQRDLAEKVEEEDVLVRSRKALEAKAKLYDKISSSSEIPEEDGSGVFLVDFQKKVIDNIVETRDRENSKGRQLPSDKQDEEMLSEPVPPPSDPQEEWVDYTDSLGRSRRCMKKDLPQLIQQDKDMAEVRGLKSEVTLLTLLSTAVRVEFIMFHPVMVCGFVIEVYLLVVEIRTHGVGFYQFDKDTEKRQEQMDALNELRDQTKDERGRRERLKEKRKAMLDARLAKVKQRRRLKEGVPLAEEPASEEEEIGPRLEEMLSGQRRVPERKEVKQDNAEIEPLKRDDSWKKEAPEREWDKGKEKTLAFKEERYFSQRRDERLDEFAPPSAYFDSPQDRQPPKKKIYHQQTLQYFDADFKPKTVILTRESIETKRQPGIVDVSEIPLPTNIRKTDCTQEDNKKDGEILKNSMIHKPPGAPPGFVLPPDFSVPPPGFQPPPQWGIQPPVPPSSSLYPSHDVCPPESATAHVGLQFPNISVPPPNTFGHPPDTYVPPPNNYVPPPATSIHPQNTSLPPPPPGVALGPPRSSYGTEMGADDASTPSSYPTPHTYSSGTFGTDVQEKPIFVPRTSVLDTRLVQNEDSETPAVCGGVPDVLAQPYQPGSFTAALQAQHQATEDLATASRDKAHFRGGPVIYKHEPVVTVAEKAVVESEPVACGPSTEDVVATFLKQIKDSV
ncbi:LOW QUALITY PROTEIN: coiled-coil domain-containing protein 174-like [Haliotis rubra]|uniref:LOW QUALITY PROTEIN: coiled-coil domain-containing protein 174-like n=1 Tax=Haliotis rubra TaxID=36100 RepID=UPI001EE5198A|nr:LOW QUALITY PROTEIN: coiled-coil domain-containing protein 174-like [Haliotis rubra]